MRPQGWRDGSMMTAEQDRKGSSGGSSVIGGDGTGASAVSDVSDVFDKHRRRPIPPKRYRIGDLVDYSRMSRQTIHNYTTMGLLPESCWSQGGHRLYDESVFDRLDRIAEFKSQGKSLRYMREYFSRLNSPEMAFDSAADTTSQPPGNPDDASGVRA